MYFSKLSLAGGGKEMWFVAKASSGRPGARLTSAFGLAALLLAACAPFQQVAVPKDGQLHVSTPQTNASVQIPASMRDRVELMPGGMYHFGEERSPLHTVGGYVFPLVVKAEMWPTIQPKLVRISEAESLENYLISVEPFERANPGRPGNILRSYEHVGGARPPHAAEGLVCNERTYVAEDREVPGQGGRPFLMHALIYTCIDPNTHAPVEIGWSERYPVGQDRLSAGFEAEAGILFESLRFKSRKQ
jgi:hypothetical protein